jgi:hypothetical protein
MRCNGSARWIVCQAGPADLSALGGGDRQTPVVNGNVEQWVPWFLDFLLLGARRHDVAPGAFEDRYDFPLFLGRHLVTVHAVPENFDQFLPLLFVDVQVLMRFFQAAPPVDLRSSHYLAGQVRGVEFINRFGKAQVSGMNSWIGCKDRVGISPVDDVADQYGDVIDTPDAFIEGGGCGDRFRFLVGATG